jgi:sarcosine oxidase delta subunit
VAAAGVRILVPCPYCGAIAHLLTDQDVSAGATFVGESWERLGPAVKCGRCDSRFEVTLRVRRKGIGKRHRAQLAERQQAHRDAVIAATARNEQTLESWRALAGCTCGGGPGMYYQSVTNGIPDAPRHRRDCPHAAKEG